MIKAINKIIKPTLLMLMMLLTACSSSRYKHTHDSTPTRSPNQAELTDAIARAEPHSRGGNKDYQVRGVNYQVLNSAKYFEQIGTASWYGNKFHGHLTSNGEIYDMYSMSAAHKHLPLPTYLTVTNLANNKSVVVRVNDRGPFHQNRIIDLSFSAAYKLDMLKTGTAKVKITAITELGQKSVIQVFATSNVKLAKATANDLAKKYSKKVNYPEKEGIYRIQIEPLSDKNKQKLLLKKLQENGYPNAYLRRL